MCSLGFWLTQNHLDVGNAGSVELKRIVSAAYPLNNAGEYAQALVMPQTPVAPIV